MRLPQPLPTTGPGSRRWEAWRRSQRRAVALRARGRCECCQQQRPLDWAHILGRGRRANPVSEPWASSAALTAGLCRDCHNTFDRYTLAEERRSALLWLAVERMSAELGRLSQPQFVAPEDALAELLRAADEGGKLPRDYRATTEEAL